MKMWTVNSLVFVFMNANNFEGHIKSALMTELLFKVCGFSSSSCDWIFFPPPLVNRLTTSSGKAGWAAMNLLLFKTMFLFFCS